MGTSFSLSLISTKPRLFDDEDDRETGSPTRVSSSEDWLKFEADRGEATGATPFGLSTAARSKFAQDPSKDLTLVTLPSLRADKGLEGGVESPFDIRVEVVDSVSEEMQPGTYSSKVDEVAVVVPESLSDD